jgi:hypothetical protein
MWYEKVRQNSESIWKAFVPIIALSPIRAGLEDSRKMYRPFPETSVIGPVPPVGV